MESDGALKSSQGGLQLWFRPRSNRRLEPRVVSVQSPGSPTLDSFGTPPWESREKMPFGCGSHGVTQRILYGGRFKLDLLVPLPSLIPGLLARPSYPPLVLGVGSGSKFQLSAA
ncbi:unnamed protein product [Sphagnum compactum]